MSRIPLKAQSLRTDSKHGGEPHLNWMAGPGFDISNPIANLRLAAASSFFGEPQYYHRDANDTRKSKVRQRQSYLNEKQVDYLRETLNATDCREWRAMTSAERMEDAIDKALDFSVEETLKEAVRLRNEDFIRTTPQVILVRAAHHAAARGTGLLRKYAKQIVRRADEPAVCIAYSRWRYGRAIPNSLKKALADVLVEFDDYQLAKYRGSGNELKLVDVVNLVHPKATGPLTRLMNGELSVKDKTWEGLISTEGSSQANWQRSVEVMGHMALLRNIRNLLKHNVDPAIWLDKLVATAARGKQLPFRYYSAYKSNEKCEDPVILDAIEECLNLSLENLPHFSGRVMSLCDNSGSAWGTTTSSMGTMHIAEIANLTGVLTGKRADEGHLGIFGDRLRRMAIRRKTSVFDDLKKATKLGRSIGGGTEHGIWLFWDEAIRKREHWDHVFVYSDMQAGHGGLFGTGGYSKYVWNENGAYIDVPKLIRDYRRKVNPDVMVYLVQVAGYQDTIVPEHYEKTFILGGWGDGIFRFVQRMNEFSEVV